MKWAKRILVLLVSSVMTYANFIVFQKYYSTSLNPLLLFGAIGATCAQGLLIFTLAKLTFPKMVKTKRWREQFFVQRACALLIDSAIAFVISIFAIAVSSNFFEQSIGMAISVGSGYLFLLLRDTLSSNGSLGKKVCGLSLANHKEKAVHCSVAKSLVRNFSPATLIVLTIVLSDESFQKNFIVDSLYLILALVMGIDLLYAKNTGVRIIDTVTGLSVIKTNRSRSC